MNSQHSEQIEHTGPKKPLVIERLEKNTWSSPLETELFLDTQIYKFNVGVLACI